MTHGVPSLRQLVHGACLTALIASAALVLCASAAGATTGYLYTAVGSDIERFAVGSDTTLAYKGPTPGGPTGVDYPGSLVIARTADGMNLYQLAGSGSTQYLYQYSVASSRGALSPKSSAGPIPLSNCCESHFLAVFNPAASGSAGQNALYVLDNNGSPGHYFPTIYVFDINATNGKITPAGSVGVPGFYAAVSLGYSGNTLVLDGTHYDASGTATAFQYARINPSNGFPVFPNALSDNPCGGEFVCNDGPIFMMDEDHILASAEVFDPNSVPAGLYESGVEAYATGTFNSLGSTITEPRYGPHDITSNGHFYFTTESDNVYGDPDEGDAWFDEFSPDGLSEGYFLLPAGSSPGGIFSLGSGLYIANGSAGGLAYRLSPGHVPARTPLSTPLGDALTGFLVHELTVTVQGTGAGKVHGASIACPRTCSASIPAGTHVTLTEKPSAGSRFAGWKGACSGKQPKCQTTMTSARKVIAEFTRIRHGKTPK